MFTSVYQPRQDLKAGRRRRRLVLIPVAVIVLIAGILAALLLPARGRTSKGIIYLRRGELYYTSAKSMDPRKLTRNFYDGDPQDRYFEYRMNYMVKFSKNGQRVFFPGEISGSGGEIDLYYMDLKNKNAEPVKLAKDIWNYAINKEGSRVYYHNAKNELYQSNLTDEDKIDSDVSYFLTSEDGTKLIYIDHKDNLYYKEGDKDQERIGRISEFIYSSPDLSRIYYLIGNDLYLSVKGAEGEKILSGVSDVIKIYETGEIYYISQTREERKLAEFVEDDMLMADKSLKQPIQPEYPSYEGNRPRMPIPKEPLITDYEDWNSYTQDYDIYLTKIGDYNAEWDRLYQVALEQYNREYAAYKEANQKYLNKTARDSLRKALEDETIEISHKTLYYYDTKDTIAMSNTYYDLLSIVEDRPAIIYSNHSSDHMGKEKRKLSGISNTEEVSNYANSKMQDSLEYYAAIGGIPSLIKQENGEDYHFDHSMKYLYYMDHFDEAKRLGVLYRVRITDSKLETPKQYKEEVSSYYLLKGTDTVLYFKDAMGACGDLYLDNKRIDFEVGMKLIIPAGSGDGFYYITDLDEDMSLGTLKFYNGKASKKISEDVYDFHIMEDNNILYLKDYNLEEGAGKAYLYHGKESVLDDHVSMILKYDSYFDYYMDKYLMY